MKIYGQSPHIIKKHRDRGGWTKATLSYIDKVKTITEGLKEYWPLTLRQVYYQLVANLIIENSTGEYKKLSRLLTKARIDNLITWDAFEDRARVTLNSAGWPGQRTFIINELDRFLEGYRRDLLQSQAVALEVWIEKDALSRVCHRAAFNYCVPVVVARGFSSVSYVHECRKRVEANTRRGKQTVILYFGDLDPSGWEMLPTMLETLQSEMKLGDQVIGHRCALTAVQVQEYALPRNPEALKATDPRAKKYIKQFGDLAVELDALPPATLEVLVRRTIENYLDLSQFNVEQQRQVEELTKIQTIKTQVEQYLSTIRL